jgi:RNA polymerase sigma-70 factor (sigma-E family)
MSRDHDDDFVAFAEAGLPRLRRTAYLVCGDWHRADDAAQEALIKLYRAWPRVERRDDVIAYARRTLIRVLVDHSRRPWRREMAHAATPEPTSAGVEAGVRRVEDQLVLVQALQQVSPRRRACIVLRYFNDLSVTETAAVMGCGEGTVKSQTAKGLQELRTALERVGVSGLELGEKVSNR